MAIQYRSLSAIRADLQAGKTSCVDLVEQYLRRIEERASLNAFVEVFRDEVRAKAKEVDAKLAKGEAGRLAGMVIGIKDVLCWKGHKVSAASKMLADFESLFTATAVERLLAEDVLIIGRLSCDEFAMGSSNEHAVYGAVRNPLDEKRVPGGSSGGSAAAVAAGLCHAALGSDTGGSVRQPAAFCGEIGLKPTYGRISRWGLIAYASSFDQIGPITHSVEDAALLLEIMAGEDGKDQTASPQAVPNYLEQIQQTKGKKLRIGYLQEALDSEGLDPEIRESMLSTMAQFKDKGHELVECHFPYLPYVVPCYYILTTAEASSNLARYDGVHYGYRAENVKNLEELYVRSRTEGFGAEVKRRIMLGTFVLSAGYYDAYYTQAMKVRRLIREHTNKLFQQCDLLLSPTTPTVAFELGTKSDDPVSMYLADIFTVHANLAGLPAISFPTSALHKSGLPISMQLMGRAFEEGMMMGVVDDLRLSV